MVVKLTFRGSGLRPIVFMTDFGLRDPYVGEMKGVAASLAPGSPIIDLTHDVPKFGITYAAYVLRLAYRYFPRGSVFVVVVDPTVGSERRALAIRGRRYFFVGPDNGVLVPAAEDDGIAEVVSLDPGRAGLPRVSPSFHGRDLFTPAAARIASGADLRFLGDPVDPRSLARVDVPPKAPRVSGEGVVTEVFHVDDFGNVVTWTSMRDVDELLGLRVGDVVTVNGVRCRRVKTFSHVGQGECALYESSYLLAELAIFMGSAAKVLGVGPGDRVVISWPLSR